MNEGKVGEKEKKEEGRVNGESKGPPMFKFKPLDRVRKILGSHIQGTVKEVRTESTAPVGQEIARGLMVLVLWDNGTLSFFGPDALEHVR